MDQLVNFIIRPPRAEYSPDDLLEKEFALRGRWYLRKDLEVVNGSGKKLQCSHYVPRVIPEGKALPCVIYCHGNSGCRADASEAAIILLPSNITIFTLDFSGSGLSEGEHVTLGWNEKEDLRAVVNYLRTDNNVSCIGLWGRSMGAVTSLMYGADDPSIAGMVLDSPFSNLVDLMMELVDTYKYPLPKFTVKLAIQHMRKIIKKKADFDIMGLDSVQVAQRCFVPALFGHATEDDFIRPHHSDRIFDSYMGDKNIIKFDGDHNSPRPPFYFHSITIFFHNALNPPSEVSDENYIQSLHYYDQDHWDGLNDIEYSFVRSPTVGAASTTEDAIAQLRSRRLISRTEVPLGTPHESHNNVMEPASSSNIPNGQTDGLNSPVLEDDEYVEYCFDGVTGSDIPFTMEDEERMLMEAIMESLKDLELTQTEANLSDISPAAGATKELSPEESVVPGTALTSVSASGKGSAKDVAAYNYEPETSERTTKKDDPTSTSSPSECASSSTQDGDSSDGTRATLVVQKGRTGNLLEKMGTFFRNGG